jgi:hypothetical protein
VFVDCAVVVLKKAEPLIDYGVEVVAGDFAFALHE